MELYNAEEKKKMLKIIADLRGCKVEDLTPENLKLDLPELPKTPIIPAKQEHGIPYHPLAIMSQGYRQYLSWPHGNEHFMRKAMYEAFKLMKQNKGLEGKVDQTPNNSA